MKQRVIVGWSGGKDSSLALQAIRASGRYEVAALVTTVTEGFDRISMHGVRRTLLEQQAKSLGLPLRQVTISQRASNAEYEAKMRAAFLEYKAQGIDTVVFGDLFLEDIRAYRDRMLAAIGMKALYPIWGLDTTRLARDFIADGFQAALVCIDPKALGREFAGRRFDASLLKDLPAKVDPCGENGEFHTFVTAGPIFRDSIKVRIGETVLRDSFYFCDLLPET